MRNLKKVAGLLALALVLLWPGAVPLRAERDHDKRDGAPGRTSVLRPGSRPARPAVQRRRSVRRNQNRHHRRWNKRSWNKNRRWNNGRWNNDRRRNNGRWNKARKPHHKRGHR